MRFLQAGSGPPLILLHGLLGYSFSWRFAMPALASQATTYALDMLGAGFSDPGLDHDCSLRGCGRRILQFADAMGIGRFDLLGTSHGGAVAMMAAAAAPDRIRRLILVAPVNPWSSYGKTIARFLSVVPMSLGTMILDPILAHGRGLFLRRMFGDSSRIRPGTLEGYCAPYRPPSSFRPAAQHGLRLMRTWNRDLRELESSLPRIANIPTLLLWGDRDVAVYVSSAETLRKHLNNSQLIVFPGIGHVPYEEIPEEFNSILGSFLRTTPQ
jgi:pimeloyl-ACP methyl ester carboxylesterase